MNFLNRVVGQNKATAELANYIQCERTPHALLFVGPAGVGKYFSARMFAAELLLNKALSHAEQAKQTKALLDGSYPDLHIIADDFSKKQLAAQDVRDLLEALALHSYYGHKKVAIIQEAHRLSSAASNALLLSLEEPAADTFFILVSSAPHRLLPTIISRCQSINFLTLNSASITEILAPLVDKELITDLAAVLSDSLTPLNSVRFIDPITMSIRDESEFKDYLSQLTEVSAIFSKLLKRALTADAQQERSILELSRIMLDSKNEPVQAFLWHTLRKQFRQMLTKDKADKAAHWATLLETSIETEKMMLERNAQKELQTINFMYSICEVQT